MLWVWDNDKNRANRRQHMKEKSTRKARSKSQSRRPLATKQEAELTALKALKDDAINTSDVSEVRDWSGARRGLFYRPVKQQITLRLDADVLAWFKNNASRGRKYQTEINRALREYVQQHEE